MREHKYLKEKITNLQNKKKPTKQTLQHFFTEAKTSISSQI